MFGGLILHQVLQVPKDARVAATVYVADALMAYLDGCAWVLLTSRALKAHKSYP